MTNGEKIKEIFPDIEIVAIVPNEIVVIKKLDNVFPYSNISFTLKWWNAEYKEPTIEHVQKIDKLAMMHEIYMAGVNMAGEYQGCWVRFKEIEKIVDRYVR